MGNNLDARWLPMRREHLSFLASEAWATMLAPSDIELRRRVVVRAGGDSGE